MMKLVIATPSPFARKARIALIEKNLPHEIVVQNPWQTSIAANPLGKVPALILADGGVVHDSSVIIEYLETLGAPPALIPAEPRLRVVHKQIEAIADGICDAVVLIVTERARPPEKASTDWIARQARKIPAALRELEHLLGGNEHFTPHGFGLAEIATGCALGYLDLRYPELKWRAANPGLSAVGKRLEQRPSFLASRPTPQEVSVRD
jgi:glutathione S-transferase